MPHRSCQQWFDIGYSAQVQMSLVQHCWHHLPPIPGDGRRLQPCAGLEDRSTGFKLEMNDDLCQCCCRAVQSPDPLSIFLPFPHPSNRSVCILPSIKRSARVIPSPFVGIPLAVNSARVGCRSQSSILTFTSNVSWITITEDRQEREADRHVFIQMSILRWQCLTPGPTHRQVDYPGCPVELRSRVNIGYIRPYHLSY